MMTPDEFVSKAVGLPWVRWRADWRAMDCFGLVVMWYREVMGVDIGDVPQTDIASGFEQDDRWEQCEPAPHCTAWLLWHDGSPQHVGILLQ